MLTQDEIQLLYDILDQLNVRGEEQKEQILNLMRKLRQMLEAVSDE